jgi:putative spermidine/putrescine transport system substrate-binding protein
LSTVYAAIADGTANTDAAAKFLNLLVSPEFQARIAQEGGVGYVNTKTELAPEFAKTSPLTADVMAKGKQLPWDLFNAKRVEMNERWQRDLEAR